MDSNASTPKSKKGKPSTKPNSPVESPKECEAEDRISSLPEPILHNILSFLHTKHAVGTSVLSSKWNRLWTSLPVLNFQFDNSQTSLEAKPFDETTFKKFVDNVLLLNSAPSIDKFRLSFSCPRHEIPCVESCLESWISRVISRKVQEIDLSISSPDNGWFALPFSLLTCETVRVLKIDMHCDVQLPSTSVLYVFESLKYLCLRNVTFLRESITLQIHFSFPVLVELSMDQCDWVKVGTVKFFAPKLKRLTRYEYNNNDWQNLCAIDVYAESLEFLLFQYDLTCKCFIHNSASLVDASIVVAVDIYESWVCELLRGISHIKKLALSAQVVKAVFYEDHIANLLAFPNLTSLTVVCWDSFTCELMMKLLHKSPNLESLVIDKRAGNLKYEDDDLAVALMPQCFLSHLKSITLSKFDATGNELCLVKFLLTNTRVLERMMILPSKKLAGNFKKRTEVSRQLFMLHIGSPCCVIDFS